MALPASGAICVRPGCGKPSWNLQPGEYCTKGCKNGAGYPQASGAICIRPGCGKPSWNLQPGEYCTKACKNGAGNSQASGAICVRPGCGKPSWNSQPGEYCTKGCKNGSQVFSASCVEASDKERQEVEQQFQGTWSTGGSAPQAKKVYKIHAPPEVTKSYYKKCQQIGHVPVWGHGDKLANQQRRFHGTSIKCNFSGQPCSDPGCAVCRIIQEGFKIENLGKNKGNRGAFGPGHYSTSLSSTAWGYGNGQAMLVVKVAVGVAHVVKSPTSDALPSGAHSRVANKQSGVDELMVPSDDQMLPRYLMLF